MSRLDYQAIADELRARTPLPNPASLPGDYIVNTTKLALADAIEAVGLRLPPEIEVTNYGDTDGRHYLNTATGVERVEPWEQTAEPQ